MRVLIDECLPVDLRLYFPGHECVTVHFLRAKGTQDGALLKMAAAQFDVVLTIDGNMEYQQNFDQYPKLAVIFLSALSNNIDDLIILVPAIQNALQTIRPGQQIHISQ